MSLFRQLWLLTVIATVMAFAGCFFISMHNARSYLESQLATQSNDNASSLALSMSQQSKDPTMVELQVAALFDTGHFELVRFSNVYGKTQVERSNHSKPEEVPEWFMGLFPLQVAVGHAQVSDGWKQAGTITVIAHSRFAYKALWENAIALGVWILVGGLVGGFVLQLVLGWIKRPMMQMVGQAESISDRRFVTLEEPRILELKPVVRAMNTMVERVKTMFAEQAARIDALRSEANRDALTQLPNRGFFMGRLSESLEDEDAAPHGLLLILRIKDLGAVNARLGRVGTDRLLQLLAGQLTAIASTEADAIAARLNGADFALLAPGKNTGEAEVLGNLLHDKLGELRQQGHVDVADIAAIGVTSYQKGDKVGAILARCDQGLAQAEGKGENGVGVVTGNSGSTLPAQDWQNLLRDALSRGGFELASFPALDAGNQLLHHELVLRLRHPGSNEVFTAGAFMPYVSRFNLTAQVDLAAVKLACERLVGTTDELAVNLSPSSLGDAVFVNGLLALLDQHREHSKRLWLEVNEFGFRDELETLAAFTQRVHPYGCKLGIEHFGRYFGSLPQLYELQLDYLKIDGSFIQDIDQNSGNQDLVKAIAGIASGHGLQVIAERVQTTAEWETLQKLGVTGYTGPAAKWPPAT
ncbi:diguanylate cyclase (GGDEF) domain-containing protein [Andreprevotia lacus DSM 23236]|jgi:diguanylate cyclase (GGDEF)-like protein|uniref:Diguanylate cyclase (GGDEF) domain-containing protein n=1 Tax=Andreprevotia lacus DSM 23236 TaxID=1121001 RepID=A0A1W1Y0T0_9NEIS|nr:EAL domain-containing protein [Andreprevotia lacus]SMC29734.1 diguanylate cyclase (GGDEF) domain-containing protein [Andreprevotia lacus DSM 23236]